MVFYFPSEIFWEGCGSYLQVISYHKSPVKNSCVVTPFTENSESLKFSFNTHWFDGKTLCI